MFGITEEAGLADEAYEMHSVKYGTSPIVTSPLAVVMQTPDSIALI